MPLCPQITNTPITVTQTADFTVASVTPALANTRDGLASTIINISGDATEALADAAAAQATANTALSNAATAQSTANTAISNASTALSTANTAIANANIALAEAEDAYDAAVASLQPSANTIVNASNQITAINGNGITVYAGSSPTSGARVVLNSAGLAGFNASNNATFSVSASTGAAVFSGNVTGATITGSDLNIAGKFIVNGSTGIMTATDAIVTGNITATTGTFTGTVIATTGTFTGTVFATTGTFTGTVIATTGVFTGTVIATTGTFTGTVIATTGSFTGSVFSSSGTIGGWTMDSAGYLRNTGLSTFLYPSNASGGNANTYALFSDRGVLCSVVQAQSSATTALFAPSGGLNVGLGITAAGSNFVVSSTGAITSVGNITSTGSLSTGSATFVVGSTGNITTVGSITSSGNITTTQSITATLDITANRDLFTPNHTTVTDAANGRVTVTLGRVTRSTASSQRYKENIIPLKDVAELDPKKLLNLPVRAFTYREDYLSESDSRFGALIPGFIAEEVDAVYPTAADYENGEVESWNDRMIIPGMLALIQDLYQEIKTLKGE